MKKIVITMMSVIAVLTASAQRLRVGELGSGNREALATDRDARMTEKKGFDDLYHFIENLDVFEYGQEEARAYYIPGHHILLNGQWKFFYGDTPQEIPTNFFEEKFSDSKWATIDVPSNWEMRGYGDPLFRNVAAPFQADPPMTPRDYNPTGAYRTTFTIPSDWNGEEVFLRFEKVASASFLWVNGQEVGYNEGAQEPAEYNITRYLKKGRNTLAMKVIKYSDGFYLEGQDYWRLAGIFDDVYLYATPKTRLFDWYVTTDLDKDYRDADLNIEVTVRSYDEQPVRTPLKVQAVLTSADGKEVARLESQAATFPTATAAVPGASASGATAGTATLKLNMSQHITNPLKWTAETPNLYELKMYLVDAATGKRLSESTPEDARQDVGFKETEMRDNVFYLNGKPLKVNAQCSHMQDPDNGHAVTDELIKKDMTILVAEHDISLMARYCDLCVIMKKGELVAIGEPKKVITPELIKDVYDVEASVGIDNEGDLYVLPKRVKIEQE